MFAEFAAESELRQLRYGDGYVLGQLPVAGGGMCRTAGLWRWSMRDGPHKLWRQSELWLLLYGSGLLRQRVLHTDNVR